MEEQEEIGRKAGRVQVEGGGISLERQEKPGSQEWFLGKGERCRMSISSAEQRARVSAEGSGLSWGQKRAQGGPWDSAEPISSSGENTA